MQVAAPRRCFRRSVRSTVCNFYAEGILRKRNSSAVRGRKGTLLSTGARNIRLGSAGKPINLDLFVLACSLHDGVVPCMLLKAVVASAFALRALPYAFLFSVASWPVCP